MNWIDVAIVSICLWGGVQGYIKGTIKMLLKLFLLLSAIALANIFKKFLANYLISVFGFEQIIKEVVLREMILPVTGAVNGAGLMPGIKEFINNTALPSAFKEEIQRRFFDNGCMTEYGGEILFIADLLAGLLINTVSFAFAFFLWAGWLRIAEAVALEHRSPEPLNPGRFWWGGVILGFAHRFLLIALITGILSAILFVFSASDVVLNFDDSVLGTLSVNAFNLLGIW